MKLKLFIVALFCSVLGWGQYSITGTGVGNNGLVMIGAVLVVTGALAVILNRRKQMKH